MLEDEMGIDEETPLDDWAKDSIDRTLTAILEIIEGKKKDVSHPPYVNLTKEQGVQLCRDYGKSVIVDYIQRINDYLAGNKGKDTYKDHSAVIRNWLRRDKVGKKVAEVSRITNEKPENRYKGTGKGFGELTKGIGVEKDDGGGE